MNKGIWRECWGWSVVLAFWLHSTTTPDCFERSRSHPEWTFLISNMPISPTECNSAACALLCACLWLCIFVLLKFSIETNESVWTLALGSARWSVSLISNWTLVYHRDCGVRRSQTLTVTSHFFSPRCSSSCCSNNSSAGFSVGLFIRVDNLWQAALHFSSRQWMLWPANKPNQLLNKRNHKYQHWHWLNRSFHLLLKLLTHQCYKYILCWLDLFRTREH